MQADQARQGVGQGGLADTGNVLYQQMAARDQTGECELKFVGLPQNDLAGGL